MFVMPAVRQTNAARASADKARMIQPVARRLSGSTALVGGVVAALLVFSPVKVQAQTWDGETSTNWGTATNWVGDALPVVGGTVVINNGLLAFQPLISGGDAFTVAQTNITSGGLTISGTLTSPVTLGGSGRIVINGGGELVGNLAYGSNGISNNAGTITGLLGVTDGTFTNTGAVTGATTVSGGTLNLNAGTNLADAQLVTVSGTGTLNVNAADTVGALNQTGGTIQGASTLTVTGLYNQSGGATAGTVTISAGTFTQSGGANLAAGTTVNSAGAKTLEGGTIAGRLGGAGATTFQTGTTTVSGTITGNVTLASGTLNINNSNAIGGSITTTGSVINYANGVNEASALIVNSNTTQLSVGAADLATQSGIISELGGPRPLEKIGAGTLVLSGANTYTGITTITAGALNIQNATGLGTTAAGTLVQTGAALELQGGIAVGAEALTLNGTGVANGGALRNISGGNIYGGAITLGSASRINADAGTLQTNGTIDNAGNLLTVGGAGSVNLVGAISGAGGLTKDGAGLTILFAANTYTGVTTVNDGNLFLQSGAAIADTSALVVNAPGIVTLSGFNETIGSLSGNGQVSLNTLTLTTGGDNTSTTFSGAFAGGTGNLIKNGTGTFTLSGTNTHIGTTINAGTLQIGDGVGGGTTGTLGTGNVVNNAALTFNRSNALTVANVISGTGAVNQIGGGTTTLTGANTYSGITTISAGTLSIAAANNLGDGSATNNIVINGGTLQNTALVATTRAVTIGAAGGTFNADIFLTLQGPVTFTGQLTKTGPGILGLQGANSGAGGIALNQAVINVSNNSSLGTGTLTMATGTTLSAGVTGLALANDIVVGGGAGSRLVPFATGGTTTLSGVISGGQLIAGRFAAGLPGTLILTGANTYGATTVELDTILRIGAGGTTGTLGTGGVTLNAATSALEFNRSDAITVANTITGPGIVNQIGTGTTILTGNSNAFTGTTNVNAGILRVNGTLGTAASTLNVNVGGTLQGIGTIGGNVNVLGGTIAAGQSPGTLNIAGNLVLNGASVSAFELGQANVIGGANNDLVNVGGNLTLDGTLNVASVAPGFSNGFYRLYNYGGALTNNTLDIGTLPAGFTAATPVTVLTNVNGQVNLQVGAVTDQFWDGAGVVGNGVINGGAGTWNAANANWTNSPGGDFNTNWQSVNGTFAGAAGGAVDVVGAQAFQQLNFTTAGYTLGGAGSLTTTGGFSIINTVVDAAINVPITGAGGLTKTGAGVLSLGGVSTYGGATDITAGTLRTTIANALPTNTAVTVSTGATFDLAGNNQTIGSLASSAGGMGSVTLGAGTLTTGGNNSSTNFAGVISGTGGLIKAGTGVFTLSGVNTYAGLTTVQAGTLVNAGTIAGAVSNLAGATFTNNVGASASAVTNAGTGSNAGTIASLTNTADTFANNTGGVVTGLTTITGGVVTNAGTLAGVSNEAGGTFVNQTGGNAGAVTSAGFGTNVGTMAALTNTAGGFNNNTGGTVTGLTTITGGSVNNAGALAGVDNQAGGTFVNQTGGTAGAVANAGAGANAGTIASLANTAGTFNNTGTVTGGASNAAGATLTTTGIINGGLTNSGTVNASGQLNGSIANNAGVITLTGATTGIGAVSQAAGAVFTLGGLNTTFGSLAGAGTFNLGSALLSTGGDGSTTAFAGAITGSGGLTKTGAGTFTLSGANTFTGLTTVEAGALVNAGTIPGAVSTLAGATFTNNAGASAGAVSNAGTGTNAGTIASLANTGGTFGNTGTIAGAAVVTGGTLNSSGIINGGLTNAATTVASGNISGGVTNTGAFSLGGPLNNNGGAFTNNGTGTAALGAFALTGVSVFTNNSTSANAVSVGAGGSLTAASVANNAGIFANAGTVTAPTFANAATLSNNGTVTAATSLNNSGTLTNGGTLNAGTFGNTGLATSTGSLTATTFNNAGTFNGAGSFNAGSASNSSIFTVTGALGGVTTGFNNSGTFNLTGGNFTGVGAFANSGTVNSSGARTLGAASFTNAATGTISMQNGVANDALTLTGTYAGVAGSRIALDVDTAAGSADRLTINGTAGGASRIDVNLLGSNAFAFATPVDVVVAGAGSTLSVQNLGRIGGRGFFDYFLRQDPANSSRYQVVSQFNSSPVSGVASGVAGVINSLQAGFHQPASAIISRPDNCQPNQIMGGPFIRLNAGETTVRSGSSGAGGGTTFSAATKSESRFSGAQGGVDLGICNVSGSGWNLHAGIMGGFVSTKASATSSTPNPAGAALAPLRTTTQVSMEVPFYGAYFFATNGPFTAEFNVRKDDYKAKVTAFDAATGVNFIGPAQRLKGDGLSYNASMSYRLTIGERAYFEPQIGLSKGTTRFDDLPFATGIAGDRMSFSKADSLLGRVGFNAGYAVSVTDNLVVVPFLNAAVWHEFAKPTQARAVFASQGLTFDVSTDRVGTFGQVGAGLQFRLLNTPLLGFVRADARFGDKINGRALNAGVRLQF